MQRRVDLLDDYGAHDDTSQSHAITVVVCNPYLALFDVYMIPRIKLNGKFTCVAYDTVTNETIHPVNAASKILAAI